MKPNGITLIELLIVLTILGILSAFCIPLYSAHIAKEKRLEAALTLNKLALAMEHYYIEHMSYEEVTLEKLGFSKIIADNRYQLIIQAATENDFKLAATPLDAQAKVDSLCGTLTLNSLGEKGVTGPGQVIDCW